MYRILIIAVIAYAAFVSGTIGVSQIQMMHLVRSNLISSIGR